MMPRKFANANTLFTVVWTTYLIFYVVTADKFSLYDEYGLDTSFVSKASRAQLTCSGSDGLVFKGTLGKLITNFMEEYTAERVNQEKCPDFLKGKSLFDAGLFVGRVNDDTAFCAGGSVYVACNKSKCVQGYAFDKLFVPAYGHQCMQDGSQKDEKLCSSGTREQFPVSQSKENCAEAPMKVMVNGKLAVVGETIYADQKSPLPIKVEGVSASYTVSVLNKVSLDEFQKDPEKKNHVFEKADATEVDLGSISDTSSIYVLLVESGTSRFYAYLKVFNSHEAIGQFCDTKTCKCDKKPSETILGFSTAPTVTEDGSATASDIGNNTAAAAGSTAVNCTYSLQPDETLFPFSQTHDKLSVIISQSATTQALTTGGQSTGGNSDVTIGAQRTASLNVITISLVVLSAVGYSMR